jgi:hypothetical protein
MDLVLFKKYNFIVQKNLRAGRVCMRNANDRWMSLVTAEFGVPDHDLRKYIAAAPYLIHVPRDSPSPYFPNSTSTIRFLDYSRRHPTSSNGPRRRKLVSQAKKKKFYSTMPCGERTTKLPQDVPDCEA